MKKRKSKIKNIEEPTLLICKICGSRNIYTLKDKTKVCRKCGERENIEKRS